ncbi:MAG: hypothetical protein R2727_11005 [Bacteroidales bacterium]
MVRQKEELGTSIHYASRIQRAILPSQELLKKRVDDYFILFRPRDIVSGDFYWVTEKKERLYICAADCTGHGVPGAFMSILGISFLDEIVNKSALLYPDEILNTPSERMLPNRLSRWVRMKRRPKMEWISACCGGS